MMHAWRSPGSLAVGQPTTMTSGWVRIAGNLAVAVEPTTMASGRIHVAAELAVTFELPTIASGSGSPPSIAAELAVPDDSLCCLALTR
jgi:hypothetical protein